MLKTEDNKSNKEMKRREKRVAHRFKEGKGGKVFGSPSEKFGLAERELRIFGVSEEVNDFDDCRRSKARREE